MHLNPTVSCLRDFLRFNYLTGNQVAQQIGVRDTTLYSWLPGKSRPRSAERIMTFLDSMPAERGGIMPTGYEYQEYKNWRGISKPRRCPFSKKAKGEIRKVRGGYQGYALFAAKPRETRLSILVSARRRIRIPYRLPSRFFASVF